MNYYDLSKNFWNLYRDKTFGHVDTAMYFYLLNECNIRRWLNPFELQTRNLELMFGISRKTIVEARNRLKQRGVIEFIEGKGRGAAIYKIIGLDVTNETLEKEFCVSNSVSVCVSSTKHKGNTKGNTKVTQRVTQTENPPLYIEDIRLKTKDNTTSEDVVAPPQPVIESLFAEEEKKASKRKPKSAKGPPPEPPTLDQVFQHFLNNNAESRLQNWEASARLFYDTFNADGWVNKYGRRITNWESEANKWIFYREEAEKKQKTSQPTNEVKQTDRFSERRGTEPTTTSRKGFKGSF